MSATAAFLVSNQVSGDSRSGSGLKVPCGVSETAGQAEARRSSHIYVLYPPAHKPKIYIYIPPDFFTLDSLILFLSLYLPLVCLLSVSVFVPVRML